MATALHNLSDYDPSEIPSGKGIRIGILVAEWNREITHKLAEGAITTLIQHGVDEQDIILHHVPGSFELTKGADWMAQSRKVDGVICLGCVIRGETPHFDYICQGVTRGITDLNLKYPLPFIFGVLTTETFEQAAERAGGKHGNKGIEAAVTVLKMIDLHTYL
ncbi:MAG: 6,7-dimethyl-8-ribityllumazine synthase [Chlorobi bacterium]|nr:6,7-dimethyl-8-ribityllumazine synthase [Chlorobiota bacterium]